MPKKNLMLKVWAWGSVRRWCRVHLQRRSTFWGMGRDYYRHYANGEEAWARAGIFGCKVTGQADGCWRGEARTGRSSGQGGGTEWREWTTRGHSTTPCDLFWPLCLVGAGCP